QFVAAGVAPPVAPERAPSAARTHIVGPDGTHGVTVHDTPVVRADMALLGRRLRTVARQAGVELIDHVGRIDPTLDGDRIVALDVEVTPPDRPARSVHVEAALFVDASGRRGVLRRRSPALAGWCSEVHG